eukprot:TRINITY_DN25149_c0_g1_i2.p3 TRINITY_DN25149_c0_g1~~TRINITY_DN25149_c0_g1_i2.p3  ORF type:complete len:120 (-),score=55.15 TRINITY_DN25149_c0_g1_i2:75-434(-)
MVHSYLAYEAYAKENYKKEFPFYLDWTTSWDSHKGNFAVTDSELLSEDLMQCMEKFIKNNEAITSFELAELPFDEEVLNKLTYVMTSFGTRQMKRFALRGLELKREFVEKLANPVSNQE